MVGNHCVLIGKLDNCVPLDDEVFFIHFFIAGK